MPSVDHPESATALLHFTRRSWRKFLAGKNLVTAQTQLRLYREHQRQARSQGGATHPLNLAKGPLLATKWTKNEVFVRG